MRVVGVGLGVLLLGVACTSPDVDPAPPSDCVAGPAILPADTGCAAQPLTSQNVPLWLASVECSPGALEDAIEQDIEAHRGDEGITDALFAVVDAGWTFDGTSQSCTDWLSAGMALGVIQALEDPAALARLDALVWRPLPQHPAELAQLETDAASALACIATPEARAEAQNIAANHPLAQLRDLVAYKIQSQQCAFYQ